MSKEKSSKKKETTPPEKREPAAMRKEEKRELAPYMPSEIWPSFDRVFERFRRDFEELLWPSERYLTRVFPRMPMLATKFPAVDLEDRGKDFLLTAEMPGFKKEDIDIQVMDDAVEIKASSRWKYDDKTKNYVHRERAAQSFYRRIELPEEIRTDEVEANLKDGVLEIVLPKKMPKPKKKITIV